MTFGAFEWELDLTAETATASTVPEPFGRPSGPGLWRVKGMMLPAYVQHVAHDLLEQGSASSVSEAIEKAVGIIKKWAAGIPVGGELKVGRKPGHPGHIHPDVQAAAQKAIKEWNEKRAIAHAQAAAHVSRSEHSMTVIERKLTEAEVVELAGATPAYGASSGYAPVSRQSREHVHRPSNEPTYGGLKPVDQMTGQEVRHHMASMHAEDVDGVRDSSLRVKHNGLHKQKGDNPARDNSSMSRKPPGKRRGRPPGSKNRPKEPGDSTRGGPGPGGVGTGKANTGYPTTSDPTRSSAPSDNVMGTEHVTAPDSGPRTGTGTHTAPSGSNVTGLQGPPPEQRQTMRSLRQSGANRQPGSPSGGSDRDMDSSVLGQKQSGASRQQQSNNTGDDNFKATPSTGQITGQVAPPAAVSTAAISRANARTNKVHSYSNPHVYDPFGNVVVELAVGSPTAATRKAALASGEALPPKGGGSPGKARFPLTNRTLASRAVKMVQFAKGDQAQVRRYIMRVLRKKGWADLIPSSWTSEGTSK